MKRKNHRLLKTLVVLGIESATGITTESRLARVRCDGPDPKSGNLFDRVFFFLYRVSNMHMSSGLENLGASGTSSRRQLGRWIGVLRGCTDRVTRPRYIWAGLERHVIQRSETDQIEQEQARLCVIVGNELARLSLSVPMKRATRHETKRQEQVDRTLGDPETLFEPRAAPTGGGAKQREAARQGKAGGARQAALSFSLSLSLSHFPPSPRFNHRHSPLSRPHTFTVLHGHCAATVQSPPLTT